MQKELKYVHYYRRNKDKNQYYTGLPTKDETLMTSLNLKLFNNDNQNLYFGGTFALTNCFFLIL